MRLSRSPDTSSRVWTSNDIYLIQEVQKSLTKKLVTLVGSSVKKLIWAYSTIIYIYTYIYCNYIHTYAYIYIYIYVHNIYIHIYTYLSWGFVRAQWTCGTR